jgi:hypothetical protein
MDPVKVARVAEWPTLKLKKEVQQFVGFVNYFSHIAQPLYDMTGNAPVRVTLDNKNKQKAKGKPQRTL